MNIDTVLSSKNNKDVLNTLLEMRTRTDEHEDPPITLLHGTETEKVLRTTLMRIKVEQEEAAEANRRAKEAAANQAEEDSDDLAGAEEEDLGDESEEKVTTFIEDLEMITDFKCFSASEFTTKVMQGDKIRCMLGFAYHEKPSKE